MELNKIETLLEKYFEGQTSIDEERELGAYFSSSDVAQHLKQYQNLFNYFSTSRSEESQKEFKIKTKKTKMFWLSVAASASILIGTGAIIYSNTTNNASNDLGTFDNPEVAFKETQKALQLLSKNVNVGIESVSYINEFQDSKNLIFKK
jgi:hypothetical protein